MYDSRYWFWETPSTGVPLFIPFIRKILVFYLVKCSIGICLNKQGRQTLLTILTDRTTLFWKACELDWICHESIYFGSNSRWKAKNNKKTKKGLSEQFQFVASLVRICRLSLQRSICEIIEKSFMYSSNLLNKHPTFYCGLIEDS